MFGILSVAKDRPVIAFTVLYILVTMIASKLFNFTASGGGALEFKRSKAAKQKVKATTAPSDVEKGNKERIPSDSSGSSETLDGMQEEEALQRITSSESIRCRKDDPFKHFVTDAEAWRCIWRYARRWKTARH